MKLSPGGLRWSARILSLLFAGFLSVFSADVFGEGYHGVELALALLMHLMPSILVIIVMLLSWKREWIGAICYTFLGILYVATTIGRFNPGVYFVIAGPMFLMAILYLLSWRKNRLTTSKSS